MSTGLAKLASTDYYWTVIHGCHPERSEGPLKPQERSLAALGMTAGPYQSIVIPGTSLAFLRSLSVTAGALYAFVQAAFEPLTTLRPPGMRLVNVGLLAIVAVSMTWGLAGLTLSEMPALVFAALSLCLLLKGLRRIGDQPSLVGWFLASAVCLAVAAWGRQPYLLLVAVPAALALVDARLRLAAAVFVGIVLAMVVPLFVIWGGLTPPSHLVQESPTLKNSLISLGYAGFALLLLVPGLATSSAAAGRACGRRRRQLLHFRLDHLSAALDRRAAPSRPALPRLWHVLWRSRAYLQSRNAPSSAMPPGRAGASRDSLRSLSACCACASGRPSWGRIFRAATWPWACRT